MFNLFFFFNTTALKFDFPYLGVGGMRLNIIIFSECAQPHAQRPTWSPWL